MTGDIKTVEFLYKVCKEVYDSENVRRSGLVNKARMVVGFTGFVVGVALHWGVTQISNEVVIKCIIEEGTFKHGFLQNF